MNIRDMDGQMDFLGLINEYTDSQGAVVRVREPGRSKLPKSAVSDFEQLSFEFGTTISDAEPMTPPVITPINEVELPAVEKETEKVTEEPDEATEENAEEATEVITEVITEEAANEVTEEVADEVADETTEKIIEDVSSYGTEVLNTEPENENVQELLFKQCKKCWCFDCKHNSRNGGVPREICGTMMACPACNDCISEDMATICEIGNAKEGCRTRALEEGIIYEEEFTEG